MPYLAQISRANPSCFLFLVDQSGSMQDVLNPTNVQPLREPVQTDGRVYTSTADGPSKGQVLADAVNRLLQELVLRCSKDEVRDYYHIGVIGYRTDSGGRKLVGPAFTGALAGRELVPISEVASNPARIDERTKKVSDGLGGLVDQPVRFPIWFDPVADGATPMCEALKLSHRIIDGWLNAHPNCFPPVVINMTDGESTDGNPTEAMNSLSTLCSTDGNVLLFNLHLSSNAQAKPISFPASEDGLPDDYARTMFNGSNPLTSLMREYARSQYDLNLPEGARGFVLNAGIELVIMALDIGTKAQNLR